MNEFVNVFEGKQVRVRLVNGEPWFVAKDVAEALGISWSGVTLAAIPDAWKGVMSFIIPSSGDRGGGEQSVSIISEAAVYKLAFRSRKPEAERFTDWVAETVLPSIRKTGRYSITQGLRMDSIATRKAICAQWLEHGANKPYHFINLTRATYVALWNDRNKKKADMTREEIAELRAFEAIEYLKLMRAEEISGYKALAESITKTGQLLPVIIGTLGITA
jgi:prophage antirepressor-like protein